MQRALRGEPSDVLLGEAVAVVARALQAEICQIFRVRHKDNVLEPGPSYRRGGQEGAKACVSLDHCCLETQALQSKRAVVFSRKLRDPLASLLPLEITCAAAAPILGQHETFGVLGVYNPKRRHFTREDLLFLQSVANVIATSISLERAQLQAQRQSYYDRLTGLPNRILFSDRLAQAVAHARENRDEFAVLFVGLDRFNVVNEMLGHAVGDKFLEIMASRLQSSLQGSDTLARIGGDDFSAVCFISENKEDTSQVAQRILREVGKKVSLEGYEVTPSASIGIAVYPNDGETADTLLRSATTAMYQAKSQGRNTYRFFSYEMNRKATERLLLEANIEKALEEEQFFLLYQPQLDLHSGRIVGVEALVRWDHPQFGVLAPDRFIPVAEQSELIHRLGAWVLHAACVQARGWNDNGYPNLRVAVNLSARQFEDTSFVRSIDDIIGQTGIDPACLELELTESMLMANPEAAVMALTDIKMRGINLAMDDFGTGYSSLSYLKKFPFDRIKIDRSFVRDIHADRENAAIVDAVITVAQNLDIKVIAEGVETGDQLTFLHARHCDELQGFYIGRPSPPEVLSDLLRKSNWLDS